MSGMEDSLAAAFNSSFAMPPAEAEAKPKPKPAASEPTPETSEPPAADAPEAAEEAADWKPGYDALLAHWRAEADDARAASEQVRAGYEAEIAAAEAAKVAEAKAARGAEKDAAEAVAREAKLAAELADEAPRPGPIHKRTDAKLREAWEMVGKKEKAKEAKEAKEGKTEKAEEVTEKVTAPPSASGASAWEEVSAPHSSTDDISKSTSLSTPAPTPAGVTPTSPAAPAAGAPLTTPSLTLSLFTAPQGLTVSRVLAALGINLVLPFINGIMLGLGEITAREGVRAARLWWRGERAIFGWRRNTNSSTGNTGTSVGLSGSAGF